MEKVDRFIEACEGMMIMDYDIANENYKAELAALALSFSAIGLYGAVGYLKKYKKSEAIKKIKTDLVTKPDTTDTKNTLSPADTKKLFSQVFTDVGKMVSKIKSDKLVMSKYDKIISDAQKEHDKEDHGWKLSYKLVAKILDQYSDEMIIEVIDGDQDSVTLLNFIIRDMIQALEIKYPTIRFEDGDGDEGCIYVRIK